MKQEKEININENARVLSPQKTSKAHGSSERSFNFPFKWLGWLQNHLNL